ncbi:terminase small subunit [Secundilactobacillus kimchicus]|uniref:terminase small subunit n=1 Tax=Secundilactobacillus kimchicus TaxID=528209 RepID=UPI0024A9DB6E|nr:terminase small subunit [Secundilactobacillus kimchicus]
MAKKLTPKQIRFIDAYIEDTNATQAAIKAGYSKSTAQQIGAENLSKPVILKEIERRTEELRTAKVADQQEIMEFISATLRGEEQEIVVTPSGMKIKVPAKIDQRLKAAELMGKRYAMWTENRNVNATVGPVKIIDDVPDEDPPTVVDGFKGDDTDG